MKAIHLIALAASLAATACRSTTTASLAPAGPAPAPILAADAPDALPVALARRRQEPTGTQQNEPVEAPAAERGGWRFSITPNLFYAGANGAVDVDNDGEDLASSAGNVFDDPDLGGILGLELGHSDSSWMGLVDLVYLDTQEDGKTTGGAPAELDLQQFIAELSAGLELQPDGLVDLLFGARFWSVSADVTVDLGPPTGEVSGDTSETWVDPLIGLRSRLPLCSCLDVLLRGDVAGFGLGSEFSSHLAAGLDWSLGESFSLGGGYRQYYVNYNAGALDYDFKVGGLYLGLTWRL